MKTAVCVFAFLGLAAIAPVFAQRPGGPGLPAQSGSLTEHYREDAARILDAAANDTYGYDALTYLCDHIGNRNSGTPQLNTAVQWSAELMRKAGLENVAVQPMKVPHWVRGQEEASIVAPINRRLHMIGLGMSVGTSKEGITAPVLFVHDYAVSLLQKLKLHPQRTIRLVFWVNEENGGVAENSHILPPRGTTSAFTPTISERINAAGPATDG
jgi:hypothetical protein